MKLKLYEYFIMMIAFLSIQINVGQFIAFGSLFLYIIIKFMCQLKSREQVVFSLNNIIVVFLWVIIVLSLIRPNYNTNNNHELIIQLFWLLTGTILLCSILLIRDLNSKAMFDIMVYTSTILGIIIIVSFYLKYYPIKYIIIPPYAGTRIVGGFDGPNELAAFNLFPFTYSLNMILFTKEKYKKKYILNLFITSIIIILTWSRGGMVGWIISLGFSLIVYLRDKITIKNFLLIFFLVSIIILIINYFVVPSYFDIRKNASSRFDMIKVLLVPIIEKPLLGWGLGAINNNIAISNTTPHNGYIFIMYAGGIISLLLYIAFLLIIFWKITVKRDLVKFSLYITFLVQELVFNNLIRGRVSFIFWILIILIFCGDNIHIYHHKKRYI